MQKLNWFIWKLTTPYYTKHVLSASDSGFINSSFAIVFHVIAIFIGLSLGRLFPDYLGIMPVLVCIGLPVLFFWFFYFLNHHTEAPTAAVLFLTFAMLCAFFAILSAAKGSLDDGTMPILTPVPTVPQITFPFLNLFFVSYTGTAPVLASVVMYYGALSYLLTSVSALTLERIYTVVAPILLPGTIKNKLADIDKKADRFVFATFSNREFMGQNLGVYVILIAIAIFVVTYALVLSGIK